MLLAVRIDEHDGPWTWRGEPIPMALWLNATRTRLLATRSALYTEEALPSEQALRYADYCARSNHELYLAHEARVGAGVADAAAGGAAGV